MSNAWLKLLVRLENSPKGSQLLEYFQTGMLREQVRYTASHSPFYRKRFAEAGVDPQSIRTIEDLPRLGFFTTPADLQTDPYDFLAAPRREILYALSSSGTTGQSKIVFLTRSDWESGIRTMSLGMELIGLSSADVAQILFSYGNPAWMTGSVAQAGFERLGAFVVPSGNSITIEKQIETIRRFGSTVLLGTPSYLLRLTAEGQQYANLAELGVRMIRLGAEPFSESLRTHLENAWGARVYDTYGMMELGVLGAGECMARNGLHLSASILVEVIDPVTGSTLPPGQTGELVYTTLRRRGSPLLRYRSGDLGTLLPKDPCSCGMIPTRRMSRIQGRLDDMVIVGSGENMFPAQVEAALIEQKGIGAFQVVIDAHGYQDRLTVRVEVAEANGLTSTNQISEQITNRLYRALPFLDHEIHTSQTIAPLAFEFLPIGAISASTPIKMRRLLDKRQL